MTPKSSHRHPAALRHWTGQSGSCSRYVPILGCGFIEKAYLDNRLFCWIHHHETIHGMQYLFTTYGFHCYLLSRRQTESAARAYAARYPIIIPGQTWGVMPPLVDEGVPTTEITSPHLRDFIELEFVNQCLDSPETVDRRFPKGMAWLLQVLERNPGDYFPVGIVELTKACIEKTDGLALGDAVLPWNQPAPVLLGAPLGARHLLEAGAMVAQSTHVRGYLAHGTVFTKPTEIEGGRIGPSVIQLPESIFENYEKALLGKEARYRASQILFLQVVVRCAGKHKFREMRRTLSRDDGVSHLLYDYPREPLDLCFEARDSLECEYHFVFLNLIDLALMTPIAEPFHAFTGGLTWFDYHPGWRFVRLLGAFEEWLSLSAGDVEEHVRWACYHPRTFADALCKKLGWPPRIRLYELLKEWIEGGAGSFPYRWQPNIWPVGYRAVIGCLDALNHPPVYWHVSYFEKGHVRLYEAASSTNYQHWPVPMVRLVYSRTGHLLQPFSRTVGPESAGLDLRNGKELLKANTLSNLSTKDLFDHIDVRALLYWYAVWGTGKKKLANLIASEFCHPQSKPWIRIRDAVQELADHISQEEIPRYQAKNFPPRRDPSGGMAVPLYVSPVRKFLREQGVIE